MAKRQIAVRVEAEWEKPFSPSEFYGVGRSVQVTFSKRKPQRTVGDVLQEKIERAFSKARGESTAANRSGQNPTAAAAAPKGDHAPAQKGVAAALEESAAPPLDSASR
jgi:hypothetical protein